MLHGGDVRFSSPDSKVSNYIPTALDTSPFCIIGIIGSIKALKLGVGAASFALRSCVTFAVTVVPFTNFCNHYRMKKEIDWVTRNSNQKIQPLQSLGFLNP